MSREKSLRREKRPLANQLTLAAGLCVALVLAAPSAIAQADPSEAATVTIFSNLGPSSTNLFFTGTPQTALGGFCIVGADLRILFCAAAKQLRRGLQCRSLPLRKTLTRPCFRPQLGCLQEPTSSSWPCSTTIKALRVPPSRPSRSRDAPGGPYLLQAGYRQPGHTRDCRHRRTQYWLVATTDDVNARDFRRHMGIHQFCFRCLPYHLN